MSKAGAHREVLVQLHRARCRPSPSASTGNGRGCHPDCRRPDRVQGNGGHRQLCLRNWRQRAGDDRPLAGMARSRNAIAGTADASASGTALPSTEACPPSTSTTWFEQRWIDRRARIVPDDRPDAAAPHWAGTWYRVLHQGAYLRPIVNSFSHNKEGTCDRTRSPLSPLFFDQM